MYHKKYYELTDDMNFCNLLCFSCTACRVDSFMCLTSSIILMLLMYAQLFNEVLTKMDQRSSYQQDDSVERHYIDLKWILD